MVPENSAVGRTRGAVRRKRESQKPHAAHRKRVRPTRATVKSSDTNNETSDASISNAFINHESNLQVRGEGIVTKLLPDDTNGNRHQKFIISLASGQTLLVAHNIDLASPISSLKEGDTIEFLGEYEWNEKGGVLHWTHRDPNGNHQAGWIKHNGQIYQ